MATAMTSNKYGVVICIAGFVLISLLSDFKQLRSLGFLTYVGTVTTQSDLYTADAAPWTIQEDDELREPIRQPNSSQILNKLENTLGNVTVPSNNSNGKDLQPDKELPPLHSLINGSHIIADVSSMLDFAVIGFPKCGTTTLRSWLGEHRELFTYPGEPWRILTNQPVKFVFNLHRTKQWQFKNLSLSFNRSDDLYNHLPKIGYKNPVDIYTPHALDLFQKYWPTTKLIISVRHPVKWFESYWSFRYPYNHNVPNSTLGRLRTIGNFSHFPLHTGMGEYHVFMSYLGKTLQNGDSAEWSLLSPFLKEGEAELFPFRKLPNQVFLIEKEQLGDTNVSRREQLSRDMQSFLGLESAFPPMVMVLPETANLGFSEEVVAQRRQGRLNICLSRYDHIRENLMTMSRAASQWLTNHFMQSEDVHVSSPEYVAELFADWMYDPCVSRNSTNYR